tara:strand:- start:503 stop:802 length:300 start_codon:yes stop_codon:yes gene_type:complete
MDFKQQLQNDFNVMLDNKYFGVSCLNTRTNLSFDTIFTDAYTSISDEGLLITENIPMISTKESNDIKQNDVLTIDNKNYIVFEVQRDGISGIDVRLKYA